MILDVLALVLAGPVPPAPVPVPVVERRAALRMHVEARADVAPSRAFLLDDHDHDHDDHEHDRARAHGPERGAGPAGHRLAHPAHEGHDRHDGHEGHAGFDHHHASPLGTPQLHAFLTEPAFLGRDVLAHVVATEDDVEAELEVEWALSSRWLVVVGASHTRGEEEDELGPVEAALRYVVCSGDRTVLSVQAGVEVPTRSEESAALGFAALGWLDLGRDVTLQGSLGIEVEPEEDAAAVPFSLALGWTTPIRSPFACPPEHGHAHGAEPRLSLLAELGGRAPLGDDEETGLASVLGLIFPLTREVEVRAGWLRGLSGEDEGTSAIVLGTVLHL